MNRDQALDEINAIQFGHLNIHGDNIRLELLDLLEGFFCIGCHSDHFNPGISIQTVFQNGTEKVRVINDQQSDLLIKTKFRHGGQLLL